MLRLLQVLEAVGAHVAQARSRRQMLLHPISGHLREQHLAPVGDGTQAGAAVDAGTIVVAPR